MDYAHSISDHEEDDAKNEHKFTAAANLRKEDHKDRHTSLSSEAEMEERMGRLENGEYFEAEEDHIAHETFDGQVLASEERHQEAKTSNNTDNQKRRTDHDQSCHTRGGARLAQRAGQSIPRLCRGAGCNLRGN